MKIRTKRGYCDVLEHDCLYRSCLHMNEDKGSYTQGRGYTSYHKNPQLVCWSRHMHGCPGSLPQPDYTLAKCCETPQFAPWRPQSLRFKNKGFPDRQKCKNCGGVSGGGFLKILADKGLITVKWLIKK